MFRKVLLALLLPLMLAACGAEPKWAPDADVARYRYKSPEPPSITLYTAIRTSNGNGGHSGLLITTANERVLFDPAGTWRNPTAPERNDVIYGITPTLLDYYIDYHVRETYHMVEQKIFVSPEVAQMVLARAQAWGAAPKATCAHAVSGILEGVPGFQSLGRTWFPEKLSKRFGQMSGVQSREYWDAAEPGTHTVENSQTEGVRATPVVVTP